MNLPEAANFIIKDSTQKTKCQPLLNVANAAIATSVEASQKDKAIASNETLSSLVHSGRPDIPSPVDFQSLNRNNTIRGDRGVRSDLPQNKITLTSSYEVTDGQVFHRRDPQNLQGKSTGAIIGDAPSQACNSPRSNFKSNGNKKVIDWLDNTQMAMSSRPMPRREVELYRPPQARLQDEAERRRRLIERDDGSWIPAPNSQTAEKSRVSVVSQAELNSSFHFTLQGNFNRLQTDLNRPKYVYVGRGRGQPAPLNTNSAANVNIEVVSEGDRVRMLPVNRHTTERDAFRTRGRGRNIG